MEIETKAMGTVSIVDKQIIELEEGFYGFSQYHRFALVDAKENPFIWIQCLDNKDLAFLAIDPFLFRPDYELDIDDALLEPLDLESPSDVVVFALITIPQDGGPITVNLQGPLIINKRNNRAMQAVLTDSRWEIKHDLVAEASVKRGVQ